MKKLLKGTKVRCINLSRKNAPCPKCHMIGKRHSNGKRRLKEIGVSTPIILEVVYSKHYCINCKKFFSLPMDHLAVSSGIFTNRARRTAIDLVVKQSMTLQSASIKMRQKYNIHIPESTLHDWIVAETRKKL